MIDFVGAPATARFGLDVLRKGGTLVVVGLYGGALSLPLPLLPQRSLALRGSYVGTLEEMHEVMALGREGKVPPIPLDVRPLDAAPAGARRPARRPRPRPRDPQAGRVIGAAAREFLRNREIASALKSPGSRCIGAVIGDNCLRTNTWPLRRRIAPRCRHRRSRDPLPGGIDPPCQLSNKA